LRRADTDIFCACTNCLLKLTCHSPAGGSVRMPNEFSEERCDLDYFLPWCVATSGSLVPFIEGTPKIQLSWLYAGLASIAYLAGSPRVARRERPTRRRFYNEVKHFQLWPFEDKDLFQTLERLRDNDLVLLDGDDGAPKNQKIVPTPLARKFIVEETKALIRCFCGEELIVPQRTPEDFARLYYKLFQLVVARSYGEHWRLLRLEINRMIGEHSPRSKQFNDEEYLGENAAFSAIINIVVLFGPISGPDILSMIDGSGLDVIAGDFNIASAAVQFLARHNIIVLRHGRFSMNADLEAHFVGEYRAVVGPTMRMLKAACQEWVAGVPA
jgi:hypothetical protein